MVTIVPPALSNSAHTRMCNNQGHQFLACRSEGARAIPTSLPSFLVMLRIWGPVGHTLNTKEDSFTPPYQQLFGDAGYVCTAYVSLRSLAPPSLSVLAGRA